MHGVRLTRASVGATLDRLAALPLAERERVPGLAAAQLPEPEEGPAPPGAYTCC